jgi:hypothetical protein
MARKTKVVVVCDRHRGDVEAVASVEIGVDGDRRTVDLCAEHLAEFRKLVRPWLAPAAKGAARGSKKSPATTRPRGRRAAAGDVGALRAWAQANGYQLSERGRIPNAVREAYAAAH